MIMSAIEDAAALVPWAAPNDAAPAVDEAISAAVRRALDGPVPSELAFGTPLLRFADPDVPTQPLLEAVLEDPLPRHDSQTCDRCGSDRLSVTDRLWIPAGASVVVVAMCWKCSRVLDRPYGPSLVWS